MKLVMLVYCLLMTVSASANDAWKEFYKEVRKEMRDRDPLKRIAVIQRFSEYDIVDAAKVLISIIDRKTNPLQMKVTASDVLGGYTSGEVQSYLLTNLKKDSSPEPLALHSLSLMKLPEANDVFVNYLIRSRNPEVLTISIRALGQIKDQKPDVVTKLLSRLNEKESISVKKAVVEALGGISSTKSVPKLITLIGDKVLTEPAIDSLQRLTGQVIGNDGSAWKKWFEGNQGFTPVNTELSSFMTAKASRKVAADEKKKEEMTSEFYGIEIKGKNILFVLDRSGSMSAAAQSHATRMDQLKSEFVEMLDTIGYDTNLGVVMFPHAVYPTKGVDKADAKFKDRVKKFIKGMGPTGTTPISLAMTYVFEKVVTKKQIDTIYLLSDGVPNNPADQVRKLIRGLNTSRYIQIHTIAIGNPSDFLKNVAGDNNGTYTHIP